MGAERDQNGMDAESGYQRAGDETDQRRIDEAGGQRRYDDERDIAGNPYPPRCSAS